MCLCPPCDEKLEAELKGKFLNELCDCDTLRRWVCLKCRWGELKFTGEYFDKHTRWEEYDEDTKYIQDHQHARWVISPKSNMQF
jgi:hypothetical protein